ncbi:DNA polymerase III delta subunit [Anseongella ginsenosidimutans]|uniref:DNA polymerase III subunit delta n=1 Tax=Anseongella ginsenosidimutans TaxID=496056 RepID=A0A4R3KQ28_9SPHI|nr:DNA polymerase III subunit delta [Anseongella ginsenosidimutans]QEC53948.1 DNA polymerase III subunit delta [Anseongella ginsenosidimutans]TCS86335.1 DNA polymerase III delta subunit [Anseongella ginsenosidimutans]
MSYAELLKDLKARKFAPLYLLQGEESYYIDLVSDYMEKHILSDAEKGFNQTVFYGKDTDMLQIVSAAKRYPMMSDHQLILVKEAQTIKKWDELIAYAENPLRSTLLVFCHKYGALDKRLKVSKAIIKHGVVLESKKLYDDKVPAWVNDYLSDRGYRTDPKTCALISEYLGNNLEKIANELDKLLLNYPPGTPIGMKEVAGNIGISKDFNVFELTAALGKRDAFKANRIINYFAANPKDHPHVVVMGALAGYFTKILIYHSLKDRSRQHVASALKVNPFFVGEYQQAASNYPPPKVWEIISLLRSYDMRLKGVNNTGNTGQEELMKELVFRVLN